MSYKDLRRFQHAQNDGSPSVYDSALAELAIDRKTGHWIWFVLPQLADLGHSEMSQRYGIADLDEVHAYLADPLLQQRLEAVISVIDERLSQPGQSLVQLMDSELDADKTVGSLTDPLFPWTSSQGSHQSSVKTLVIYVNIYWT